MTPQSVLIADSNHGRARRVANGLEASGRSSRIASHGAAALELALSEPPDLIVVQTDLPLVDGQKLAEILRANPRTRSARFLFIGGESRRASALGGVGDVFVPGEAENEEILDAVESLLDRLERIRRLEERADEDRDFEGRLSELRPAELLQMLHDRGATGRLTLTPELDDGSSPNGFVLLVDGEIDSAVAGSVRGEKALFRMLDWGAGEFHFEQTPIVGSGEIQASTRAVLAEGLRQLEEWNRLSPRLPPLGSPVRLCVDRGELPQLVHPLTQEVLGLIEEVERVGDVVDQSVRPDYQVLRTLFTLEERGIIEFGRAHIAPTQALGHALFNEAQCRRLRGFAQADAGQGRPAESVKLLVAAANDTVSQRFASLLQKVPGAELAPRFERGRVGPDGLETMARIDVDGDFGIDLIHLPTRPTFAPLWAFAGHRALGTIFLLDTRVGASTAEVSPVGEALGDRSDTRTFHVVLLSEGERLSPDEIRDNLSLLDDASLFLLPFVPDKDPGSLLRSLFARIVP
ncbi:MAG TPA: DUF4388 domain-containing protein [Deltaproteobacteria bacterium]|nr:DUF4388 domain-containing protein [Deltaproteobacteria bacterium]